MTTMTAQTTQVYQLFIKASPEAIWEAITNPDSTEKYFYGIRIAATADRRVTQYGDHEGEDPVFEFDPPRRLVHGWRSDWDPRFADEESSRVTWEIEPQDGGISKLTVTHDQLEGAPKTAAAVAGGWMLVISGLKTLLETGAPLA